MKLSTYLRQLHAVARATKGLRRTARLAGKRWAWSNMSHPACRKRNARDGHVRSKPGSNNLLAALRPFPVAACRGLRRFAAWPMCCIACAGSSSQPSLRADRGRMFAGMCVYARISTDVYDCVRRFYSTYVPTYVRTYARACVCMYVRTCVRTYVPVSYILPTLHMLLPVYFMVCMIS